MTQATDRLMNCLVASLIVVTAFAASGCSKSKDTANGASDQLTSPSNRTAPSPTPSPSPSPPPEGICEYQCADGTCVRAEVDCNCGGSCGADQWCDHNTDGSDSCNTYCTDGQIFCNVRGQGWVCADQPCP